MLINFVSLLLVTTMSDIPKHQTDRNNKQCSQPTFSFSDAERQRAFQAFCSGETSNTLKRIGLEFQGMGDVFCFADQQKSGVKDQSDRNAPDLKQVVADLGADKFAVRESAERQLKEAGSKAWSFLRDAAKDAEVERRVKRIVDPAIEEYCKQVTFHEAEKIWKGSALSNDYTRTRPFSNFLRMSRLNDFTEEKASTCAKELKELTHLTRNKDKQHHLLALMDDYTNLKDRKAAIEKHGKTAFSLLGSEDLTDSQLSSTLSLTPNLYQLSCDDSKITDAGLDSLKHVPKLRTLYLRGTAISDSGLQKLAANTELDALNIGKTKITDAGLKHLHKLKRLDSLSIHETKVSDEGLKQLSKLSGLFLLDVSGNKITDAGLAHLAGLKQLTHLNASSTMVTDAGLKHLSDLDVLQDLSLKDTKVADAGIKHLSNTSVNELDLSGTKFTDKGAAHIPSLKVIKRLWLDRTALTDEGISALSKATSLRHLSLIGTAVTDACLDDLKALENLSFLDLTGTKVTDTGIEYLRKALPNCEIKR
jgi:Leucine-rich repeat (LRR) protein